MLSSWRVWVAACAAVLLIAWAAASQAPAQPVVRDSARTAPVAAQPVASAQVEVTKALAWPVAAILLALLLRAPVGRFLVRIAPRITKLGAFQVQLELAASTQAAGGAALAEIRSLVSVAPVGDSSAALFSAVQDTTPADHAVIVLGVGDEWLTRGMACHRSWRRTACIRPRPGIG